MAISLKNHLKQQYDAILRAEKECEQKRGSSDSEHEEKNYSQIELLFDAANTIKSLMNFIELITILE